MNEKAGCCGMVIRYCKGEVVISASRKFLSISSPLLAEIRANLVWIRGLALARALDLACGKWLLSSNFGGLIKVLFSTYVWFSIIADILIFKDLCFVRSFNHVKWVANKLAHDIAKAHDSIVTTNIWQFGLPLSLYNWCFTFLMRFGLLSLMMRILRGFHHNQPSPFIQKKNSYLILNILL